MNVLLVEDNSADAYLLKELLSSKKGAPNIHWVTDGYEALDYVLQRNEYTGARRPDIILLDLGLPRINGYEVIKQMKNDPNLADIPIIILTTSYNALDRMQCSELGADRFITKPHSLKGYESLVEQLITSELPELKRRAQN